MKIFEHTHKEKGMWRGWIKNGQCLELHHNRTGWEFGLGVLIHSNDSDDGDRMLRLNFWRYSAYIPLGIVKGSFAVGDEPQWSIFGSKEFGLWLRWGLKSKLWNWPFHVFTLRYEYEDWLGEWQSVLRADRKANPPKLFKHPYTYVLESGEVQRRFATIHCTRHILGRHILHRLGWPKRTLTSINVEFSEEVGERSGSWKGGCIGCSYPMRDGETRLATLRRMERERKF
jgi:hypothetical protein